MFGYVRACAPDLKVKEFEAYKACYCGLCKEQGRGFGPVARVNLSYDMVFMALVGLSLEQEPCAVRRGMCAINPLRRKNYFAHSPVMRLVSDANAILTYWKLKDDLHDEGMGKKLRAALALPFFSLMRRRAGKRRPELDALVARGIADLALEEAQPGRPFDAYAHHFAVITGGMFAMLSDSESTRRVLHEMGYHIGRYVYLCDAYDDLERDLKKRRFNALAASRGVENLAQLTQRRAELTEFMSRTCDDTNARVAAAFDLLQCRHYNAIIENIVKLGLSTKKFELIKSYDKAKESG